MTLQIVFKNNHYFPLFSIISLVFIGIKQILSLQEPDKSGHQQEPNKLLAAKGLEALKKKAKEMTLKNNV